MNLQTLEGLRLLDSVTRCDKVVSNTRRDKMGRWKETKREGGRQKDKRLDKRMGIIRGTC